MLSFSASNKSLARKPNAVNKVSTVSDFNCSHKSDGDCHHTAAAAAKPAIKHTGSRATFAISRIRSWITYHLRSSLKNVESSAFYVFLSSNSWGDRPVVSAVG